MTGCFWGFSRAKRFLVVWLLLTLKLTWKARALGSLVGVVAMSNSKQGGRAAVPPGRLTMDEYKHLGNLLQKAKEENRLGEVFVFANIEKAAMEQLQSYQSPVVMPKAKAKTGGHGMSSASLAAGSSMTDASKRRLPVEDEDAEWTNAGVVDSEGLAEVFAEQQVLAYAGEGPLATPYPEVDPGLNRAGDIGLLPAVEYENLDYRFKLPPKIDSSSQWGATICVLPKYRAFGWSYEQMVRMGNGGDYEVHGYLKWLKATYAKTYLEKGPKSAGIDMAGFLGRLRYGENPDGTPVEGFRRTFAN